MKKLFILMLSVVIGLKSIAQTGSVINTIKPFNDTVKVMMLNTNDTSSKPVNNLITWHYGFVVRRHSFVGLTETIAMISYLDITKKPMKNSIVCISEEIK